MKISDVITELASTIAGAQLDLDREAQRDALLWQGQFDRQKPAAELGSIIESLRGNLMRISGLSVKTELSLEQRKSRDINIGLSLFAQPVHSFYHSRFSETRTSSSYVEIDCVAAPVHPPTQQTTDLNNDERTLL
jgi:hypothetical protein